MQELSMIELIKNFEIPLARKEVLSPLIQYLQSKVDQSEPIHLNFICTHNSRRSQFGQFWSAYFSAYFNLEIESYSGGTEVTACHPNTIAALERNGYEAKILNGGDNPQYQLKSYEGRTVTLFSKLHHKSVPTNTAFAALMCCSEASENCPFVAGTEITVPLYYEDPKQADGTSEMESAYDACCLQIAAEIHYCFSKVKKG